MKTFSLFVFLVFISSLQAQVDLLITNVNIVDVAAGKILPNQIVSIKGNRIIFAGPAKGKLPQALDPLQNIRATQRIEGVIHAGKWWSKGKIQEELLKLQKWVENKEK